MHKPKITPPPGACDTHMHFYHDKYPTAPTAVFTPPNAWVDDYRAVQARLGIERVVVVQPSTYGFDNRCTLEAMAPFGDNARAILVPKLDESDETLAEWTRLGGRGVRYHQLPGGATSWDDMAVHAARVHEHGWHVQLQFNGRELTERKSAILALPGQFVIDHVGRYMDPVEPEDENFKTLLSLLDTGRCWVKLSAPYESSVDDLPDFEDVTKLARILAKHAPERMLWATNWPHPSKPAGRYDEADMLDLLLKWVDDEAVRNRILVDNPAALYGF